MVLIGSFDSSLFVLFGNVLFSNLCDPSVASVFLKVQKSSGFCFLKLYITALVFVNDRHQRGY